MQYDLNKITEVTSLCWGHQDYYLESAIYDGKELNQDELEELESQNNEFAYETFIGLWDSKIEVNRK